ncbi:MAG: hypothetical protein E3J54_05515, partial [Actinobacteria bacterium]
PEIRWTEIVGKIYQQIIGEHLAFQKRSFEIHRKLLNEVIKGGGFNSITKTASSLINKPVFIEDENSKIIAQANLNKEQKKFLEKRTKTEANPEKLEHAIRYKLNKGKRYPAKVSVPIVVGQSTLGYVSTLEEKSALNNLDLIALEHTATVTAVEMGKERIKFETETRLKGDFIDDLITKQFQSTEALLKRASLLGCDLKKGAVVLVVDIDDFDKVIEQNKYNEEDRQRIRREFFNTVKWVVDLEHKSSLVNLKSDSTIVFLTPRENNSEELEADAMKVAQSLQRGLKSRFKDLSFSTGLSSYQNSADKVEQAFNEARVVLDINKRLGKKGATSSFKEIGTYKLLATMLDSNFKELNDFYQDTLASLIDYDKEHDSELVKTLDEFFKNNENINDAAKALFAHRHTVRYRLERIKKLTGLDINVSDDKERLALGLKLSHLLK